MRLQVKRNSNSFCSLVVHVNKVPFLIARLFLAIATDLGAIFRLHWIVSNDVQPKVPPGLTFGSKADYVSLSVLHEPLVVATVDGVVKVDLAPFGTLLLVIHPVKIQNLQYWNNS